MKALLLLCASILLSGAGVAAHAVDSKDSGYPPYVMEKKLHATHDFRGKKAPKLRVAKWLSGTAPQTQGKVVIIEFWATWCPDCRRLIPELNKFKKKFGDDLVIISITDESEKVVKKFLENTSMDSHIALAPDKKMYKTVGVNGIPELLVISADGIVRFQGYADSKEDPLTEQKLAQIIKASNAAKRPH